MHIRARSGTTVSTTDSTTDSTGRPRGPFLRATRRAITGVLVVLVAGNALVAGAWLVMRARAGSPPTAAGIHNFRVVDDRVLRGDAPTAQGYRSLAELGVTTVVDLRAERNLWEPRALLNQLGLRRFHLPVRDGQTPRPADVRRVLDIIEEADGRVYVHCGAGVGRTGAMVAAYLVATGQSSATGALAANLAVGPPSLEQIVYAASLDGADQPRQPPVAVEVLSRFLDAPRRIWSRLRA